MKFELEAKVMNGKVITNAKEMLENLDEGLKKYNYVVTHETYEQAKKDRSSLNKVVKMVSDERKRVENDLFSEWKHDKENIMAIEKKIKSYSDLLGVGINDIDQEEREYKKKQICELWSNISNDKYNFELVYEDKYANKTTPAKFIEDDLKKKFQRAEEQYGFMETFLPADEFEAEQVKNVYFNTLDLMLAKGKADELARLRAQVQKAVESNKQETTIEQVKVKEDNNVCSSVEQVKKYDDEMFITFRVKGSKATIQDLNVMLGKFMKEHTDFKLEVLEKGVN